MLGRLAYGVAALITVTGFFSPVPLTPAAAQGFLELLFGGFRSRPERVPSAPASVPTDVPVERESPRVDHAPRRAAQRGSHSRSTKEQAKRAERSHGQQEPAFCVRLCDGWYFPLSGHQDNESKAETCTSLCPASPTRLFYGTEITEASDREGKNYSDIPNALLYRKQLVAGCTCNGREQVGLAHVSLDRDQTLQKGDLVALPTGLVVYNGHSDRRTTYTPIARAHLPNHLRKEVTGLRVVQSTGSPQATVPLPRPRLERNELRTSANTR
jgi:hypothetical protein